MLSQNSMNLSSPPELSIVIDKKAFSKKLLSWYSEVKRDLPWRLLWEKEQDPYHVWVSEIMLQQTVIGAVLPAYVRFLERFPNPQSLAKATEEDVRQAARGLGYYRRFRYLHNAAKLITEKGKQPAEWPTNFKSWLAIPGVGQYTAAALASITLNEAVPVVDGNVERLFCRLLDIRSEPNLPALKRYFFLIGKEIISEKNPGDFNQALMEMGQTICRKNSPLCQDCPLKSYCLAYERGSQEIAPKSKKRAEKIKLQAELYLPSTKNGELIGLMKRPATAKFLKGTWGFTTRITRSELYEIGWDGFKDSPIDTRKKSKLLGAIKHNITKHEISVKAYEIPFSKQDSALRWIRKEMIEESLVSSLDQKAWKLFNQQ